MLLSHAVTLAEARSYVAALADLAMTCEASIAYEHVLIGLDALHRGEGPSTTEVMTADRAVLFTVA
jgi:hypothetical protein